MSRFLILHGLDGSGPGHWQPWLAERLRSAGHDVAFPDLPDPSDPHPEPWAEVTWSALGHGADAVVCHSLACLLWLRLATRAEQQLAGRVLLVAPPCRDDVEPVARFLDHGAAPDDVGRAAASSLLVCSDADPYCPPGAVATYAEPLAIEAQVLIGAGHINTDAGYGAWPAAEDWAISGRWP